MTVALSCRIIRILYVGRICICKIRVQLEYDGLLHYVCSTTPGRNTKATDEGLSIILLSRVIICMYKVWAKQISLSRCCRVVWTKRRGESGGSESLKKRNLTVALCISRLSVPKSERLCVYDIVSGVHILSLYIILSCKRKRPRCTRKGKFECH